MSADLSVQKGKQKLEAEISKSYKYHYYTKKYLDL